MGVQTNVPRFSAYVASKSALDAFSRCIAAEVVDDGVDITTIYMPLVETPMIEPTKIYKAFPTISPEQAAGMVADGIIDRPKKIASGLGNFAEVAYAAAPKLVDSVLNMGYHLFPDSSAAKKGAGQGGDGQGGGDSEEQTSTEGMAFAYLLRGIHW
jgi:NAD(P)-dependent dehydrogenase (short-subunit alcohol dehydrogenase family)